MATVLGITGAERIAPQIDEFLAGNASLFWLQGGDSNLAGVAGLSYAYARRINITAITGRPVVATYSCTAGIYAKSGFNMKYADGSSSSDFIGDSLFGGDQVTTFTDASDFLEPWLPTTVPMTNVDAWYPGLPINGATPGAARYVFTHEATAVGHNWNETTNIYMAHIEESSLGSHVFTVRAQTGGFVHLTSTIDHSPGGAATGTGTLVIESLGSVLAGAWTANSPGGGLMQLCPFGVSQTISGENLVLSMFATWPARDPGFMVAPAWYDGGGDMNDVKLALDDAADEWVSWKFIALNTAAEGRRTHVVLDISSGLGDRDNATTSQAAGGFGASLTAIANRWTTIYNTLKAAGTIPNLASFTVLFSGCYHRVHSSQTSVAYQYTAARTAAESVSNLVVADFQDSITDAWADEMTTDWSHLSSAAHYAANDKRWLSRFFTACRLSRRLRSAA